MKKILLLAILLLTLLPQVRVAAQDLINETGYKCDDGGYEYISYIPCDGWDVCRDQCSSCGSFYECKDIKAHEKDCKYECTRCKQTMTVIEGMKHSCESNDTINGYCNLCGQPLDLCTCVGGIGTGNAGGGGAGGGTGGGGGLPPIIPPSILPPPGPVLREPNNGVDSTSVDYHRCPCMISPTKKAILDNMSNHPLYNQDNGYPNLTEDLERQLAFPEIIQQGNNGTCGPAFIQKYLAENYPQQYADCVYSLANYGCYEPWGLWLDADRNPIGITQDDLDAEHENAEWYQKRGINYTSVDAIMQSAIQTWTNNNDFYKRTTNFWGITISGYDPRKDNHDGGGMSYNDVHQFITDEVAHNSFVVFGITKGITYDLLDGYFQNANHDDYTIFAGVNIATDENKGTLYFGNGKQNHIVEVTGTDSGKYEFWCYGKNLITSEENGPIHTLLFIKNTEYAKNERAYEKIHVCHCTYCDGTNCKDCVCMSK